MLICAFDLNKEITRPPILAEIKKSDWAQLSESCYAIKSSETPLAAYNRLARFIDANDRLFVVYSDGSYWGYGPNAIHSMLLTAA